MKLKQLMAALAVAGMALPLAAHATDGMFASGYGMTANGMGGAATAMSEDTFGGANNPASMAFVGNRIDLGASIFSPRREASNTGNNVGYGMGQPGVAFTSPGTSDANYFVVPEFGINHMIRPNLAVGVSVYGNGGMNTDYSSTNPTTGGHTNAFLGSGNLGVNLMQLIVAPTLAVKATDTLSFGISPLLAYQEFSAQGLQGFENYSASPNSMTNTGTDSSTGAGVRVGVMYKITPSVTLGAQYASKISMSKMSKYAGLFPNQGELDLPENYSLGIAWQATQALKLALDYEVINYSGASGIGNPFVVNNQGQLTSGMFGASNGSGFGWQDISVWKLGAEYQYNDRWTIRAGWNHSQNPVQDSALMLNELAPGVITDHITLGASYITNSGNEWTVAYVHAFNATQTAAIPMGFGGGVASTSMYQDTLGIAYAWR